MKGATKIKTNKIFYDASDLTMLDRYFDQLFELYRLGGVDFTVEKTSYTLRFSNNVMETKVIPRSKELSGFGAVFVGKVKDHFNALPLPDPLSFDRPFFEYFRPVSTYTEVDDVDEVDLTKAYWQCALNLGYLDQKMFNLALSDKVNKMARLVAIGSLGKKTAIYKYEPPFDEVPDPQIVYADTRVFWDNIVYAVGELLREVFEKYSIDVHGMWFDAIFVNRRASKNVYKFLQRKGYPSTVDKMKSFIVKPTKNGRGKVVRIFRNGHVKEMDVRFQDQPIELKDFLQQIANA